LVDVIDDFLLAVLPREFRVRNGTIFKYRYGDSFVTPRLQMLVSGADLDSRLRPRVEQDLRRVASESAVLARTRDQLNDIVGKFSSLLDQDHKDVVRCIQRCLENSIRLAEEVGNWDVVGWVSERSQAKFAQSLVDCIVWMVCLRGWVEGMLAKYYKPLR
jgi:hypothetical protein